MCSSKLSGFIWEILKTAAKLAKTSEQVAPAVTDEVTDGGILLLLNESKLEEAEEVQQRLRHEVASRVEVVECGAPCESDGRGGLEGGAEGGRELIEVMEAFGLDGRPGERGELLLLLQRVLRVEVERRRAEDAHRALGGAPPRAAQRHAE